MVLFTGGSLFGYLAWQQASRYERERASSLFTRHLSERAVVLDRAVRDIAGELTRAAGLLGMDPSMSRDEFRMVVSDALATHRFIRAFEWAPVVTDRVSHERRVREEGQADYEIHGSGATTAAAAAARPRQYAPVLYVEPLEENRGALGFDLLSEVHRHAALKAAAARRAMALTGVIDLVQETGDRRGVLAVSPVLFEPRMRGGDRTLAGFVVVALRGQDLLGELSLRRAGEGMPRVLFELVDETGSPRPIARSAGWAAGTRSPEEWSHGFDVGGRRWRLSGQPTAAFFREHSTHQPIMLGLAAFALWESLGLMVLALTSGAHREARREQDRIVRAALDSTSEGIVVADSTGQCLLLNEAAVPVLGAHRVGEPLRMTAEWMAADGLTAIAPDQLPLSRVFQGETARELEVLVHPAPAAPGRWLSVNAAPVKEAGGGIRAGVMTFRDITAHRQVEAAARLSRTRLQEMESALDEAMIVSLTDRDGRIVYVNDGFCAISGFSRDELIGADHRICNSGYHPREFFHELWTTIRGGRTWRGTICNRSKSGRTFWVDTSIVPLAGESPGAERYLAIRTDVTDRVQQEASLRQLSNAIEQTADGIFITDSEGVIEYVNSGFELTTGFSRTEAVGQTPAIMKSGCQDAHYYETLWSTIKAGDVFRSTPINRKKNGEEFHAEQTITPIRDRAGRVTHFVSVLQDVTARIRQEERDIEMAYAARVQQRLYPLQSPTVERFDIAALVVPAAATGGDYYDFLPMPDGRLGIAIADVSGHGLGSAFIMAETRAFLRPLTALYSDPAAILDRLNPWLHRDLADSGQYVTMALLALDPSAERLEYASAGHVPGCVIGRSGEVRSVLDSTGIPLGLFPEGSYRASRELPLRPGDIIVLVTDGITEAEDPHGVPFDIGGAIKVVARHRDEPAREIARHVTEAVCAFGGGGPLADDVTVVVCKVAADEHEGAAAGRCGEMERVGGGLPH